MDNLNFVRFMNRTRIVCGQTTKYSGFLQSIAIRSLSSTPSSPILKKKAEFHGALPGIINVLSKSSKLTLLPEVNSWVKKVLDYNLTGGKHSRGLMTVSSYEMLEKPENITEDNVHLSQVLGWCIEMLQAYFCVVDDIMDGSTTRRGRPCWYQVPEVGMGAINDTILINSCIKELLEIYFLKSPQFVPLLRLFNETTLYTCMGQHIDFTMAHQTKKDYSKFTIERYETLVKYKTSYYTFRLPVLLGLSLVKDVDENIYPDIDEISFKLGHLFQIQDDFMDCYGDEAVTGKAGTDIQEGKCTWLAATALQHCNESQLMSFKKHFASQNPDDVAIIQKIYEELQLPELYRQKENEIYEDIVRRVRQISWETAPNFFFSLLDQIHKRER